jgi:triacylglycerol esterase/lipase EstA (alpha/beta hydrolase family)
MLERMRPVVLVHGIWDDSRSLSAMARSLQSRGIQHVHAIDFSPAWGAARLEQLGEQLARFVEGVRRRHGHDELDLVGFSMGALVSRLFLERLGGAEHVRTFVSIAGPHRGTLTAYALPLAGVRQMRPGSALLSELGHDISHLERVAVHCVYTPYDALIVPAASGVLRGARSVHRIPVALHGLMPRDRRVLETVAALLLQGRAESRLGARAPRDDGRLERD